MSSPPPPPSSPPPASGFDVLLQGESSTLNSQGGGGGRSAALSKLRRNASVRQNQLTFPRPRSISPPPSPPRTPDLSNPNSQPQNPTTVSLHRTASLLSRSLALAKLTGTAPPIAPPSYYSTPPPASPATSSPGSGPREGFQPLPTLEALRERVAQRLLVSQGDLNSTAGTGVKRSNTVTGGETSFQRRKQGAQEVEGEEVLKDAPELDRAEARVNLMKKLSLRRPGAGKPSAVGGSGRAGEDETTTRVRSGSVGDVPLRQGLGLEMPLPSFQSPLPVRQGLGLADSAVTAYPDADHEIDTSSASSELRSPHSSTSTTLESHASGIDTPRFGSGTVTPRGQADNTTPRLFGDFEWTPPVRRVGTGATAGQAGSALSASVVEGISPNEDVAEGAPPVSPVSSTFPSRPDPGVPLVLRRGSIPQHLYPSRSTTPDYPRSGGGRAGPGGYKTASTFGIGAVEEDADYLIRRRGSSASSILGGFSTTTPMGTTTAGVGGGTFFTRGRASDAGFSRMGSGSERLNDSQSSLGLDTDLEESEGRAGTSISTFAPEADEGDVSSNVEEGYHEHEADEVDKDDETPSPGLEIRGAILAAKVERKRESGLARSRDGAFPPPEVGYQFPSLLSPDTARSSEDTARPSSELIDTPRARTADSAASSVSRFAFDAPPLNTSPRFSRSPALSSSASTLGESPVYEPVVSIDAPITTVRSLAPGLYSPGAETITLSSLLPKRLVPTSSDSTLLPRLRRDDSSMSTFTIRPDLVEQIPSSRMGTPEPSEVVFFDDFVEDEAGSDHSARSLGSSAEEDEEVVDMEEDYIFEPRQMRGLTAELPKSRILKRLDTILGTEELDSDVPSVLDHPPRKLLLHAPVLQVVNANTVKDRHLFLFNDLLLIAKPLIETDPTTGATLECTIDTSYIVKSIVELKQLKLVAADDGGEESGTKKRHPLLVAFVDRFANDPRRAIAALIQKGGLVNDGATIANLLFRNPDLNRNQLGAYLAAKENKHILRLYIERFRLAGIRLDDALRIFLMSIKLPHDLIAAEYVLSVVAWQWTETNGSSTGFDPSLTLSLVLAIMRLSDALHSGLSTEEGIFSFPNSAVTVDDFIAAFREHDVRQIVQESLLTSIYASVRKERMEQASDNSMFSMTPDIEASIEPAKLPTRLTYRTPSELFTITIPEPDPKFTIKFHGTDLQFDPPQLNFSKHSSLSFRVTGTALGARAMVLIKLGGNAPRYQGLPLNKIFSVERAFMQHTFQIGFVNHLDVKRKYMFSTLSADSRTTWLRLLRDGIEHALVPVEPPPSKALQAGEAVAIQVLRDALIPPEELPPALSFAAPTMPRLNPAAPRYGTPNSYLPSSRAGRAGTPLSIRAGALARSNSISKTYPAGVGKAEAELNVVDRRAPVVRNTGARDEGFTPAFTKTGDDITLITEQNSLLPLVLSFLQQGAEVAPHPMSIHGSAFQPLPFDFEPTAAEDMTAYAL